MKRALVALAAALALTGCAAAEADIPLMEEEIAVGLEDQNDISGVEVECPDAIEWETGGSFRCIATIDGDERGTTVVVNMQNDDGEWFWEAG